MITTPVKLWRRGKKLSLLVGQKGELLYWTIVRVPPKNFADQAPYPVGIIKLENGQTTVGQLVDWTEKDLKQGRKVSAVIRKIVHDEETSSIIHYGIKFKPL